MRRSSWSCDAGAADWELGLGKLYITTPSQNAVRKSFMISQLPHRRAFGKTRDRVSSRDAACRNGLLINTGTGAGAGNIPFVNVNRWYRAAAWHSAHSVRSDSSSLPPIPRHDESGCRAGEAVRKDTLPISISVCRSPDKAKLRRAAPRTAVQGNARWQTGSHTHFSASALFATAGAKAIDVPFGEGQAWSICSAAESRGWCNCR